MEKRAKFDVFLLKFVRKVFKKRGKRLKNDCLNF